MGPGGDRAKARDPMRIVMDVYDDSLLYMDRQIEALFADLAARGLLEDTWVIITADHGEFFGEHDRFGHGSALYRPVIDIPLMIVPPEGQGARTVVTTPASPRELAATIADLTGSASDSPFPGRSLLRFVPGSPGDVAEFEPPLSEMKIPDEHFGHRKGNGPERYGVAIDDGTHVFMRNRIKADELFSAGDRAEAADLSTRPEEAGRIEDFRSMIRRRLGGGP